MTIQILCDAAVSKHLSCVVQVCALSAGYSGKYMPQDVSQDPTMDEDAMVD